MSETKESSKLFEDRAKVALPILVRQATVRQTITYSQLADEIGMPNPRNLNYVLGCIGNLITKLNKKKKIPYIQLLVINKQTGIPGSGIHGFISDDFNEKDKKAKTSIINNLCQEIFDFNEWDKVLQAWKLNRLPIDFSEIIKGVKMYSSSGESDEHKKLKKYISQNPKAVGFPPNLADGKNEHSLPSGDLLDVFFKTKNHWYAVEVKSTISNEDDIIRGIFQCIKCNT